MYQLPILGTLDIEISFALPQNLREIRIFWLEGGGNVELQ
jgi:hypothetical protein